MPRTRSVNENSDELFLRQSAPYEGSEQSDAKFRGFLEGNMTEFDGSTTPPETLRPHVFQELKLDKVNTSSVKKISRFAMAELQEGGNYKTVDLTNVTTIEPYAFWNSSAIEEIINANNVEHLGEYIDVPCLNLNYGEGHVFSGTNIKSLNLPKLKEVTNFAFCDMNSLKTITINDSEDCHIGDNAFSNCQNLERVYGHVVTIGQGSFKNTKHLIETNLNNCTSIGYEAFIGSGVKNIAANGGGLSVAQYAFADSEIIEFAASSLQSIGAYAFQNCESLQRVVFGSSDLMPENYLPYGLFDGCNNLSILVLNSDDYFEKDEFALPDPDILRANSFKIYVNSEELKNRYIDSENLMWKPYREFFDVAVPTYLGTEEEELLSLKRENEPNEFVDLLDYGEKGEVNND